MHQNYIERKKEYMLEYVVCKGNKQQFSIETVCKASRDGQTLRWTGCPPTLPVFIPLMQVQTAFMTYLLINTCPAGLVPKS